VRTSATALTGSGSGRAAATASTGTGVRNTVLAADGVGAAGATGGGADVKVVP
jgi:hypothetical protein